MHPLQEIVPLTSNKAYIIREFNYKVFDVRWHSHPEFEITLINKGKGKRIVGDHISDFESGDLTLIGHDLPHLFKEEVVNENDRAGAQCLVIQFNKKFPGDDFLHFTEMLKIKKLLERSRQGIQFTGKTQRLVLRKIKKMLLLDESNGILELISILNILAHSDEFNLLSSTGFIETGNNTDQERAAKVYNYVLTSYAEDINLDKAAEIVNLSKSAFCNYFKKRTNKSFSEFVNELRIGKSCKLLIETDESIANICYNVGFTNISYFNRKFRDINNLTPLEYRNMFH